MSASTRSKVSEALDLLRSRMLTSNRLYFDTLVARLAQSGLSRRAQLHRMARIFGEHSWDHDSDPSIRVPADILNDERSRKYYIENDSTRPPASQEERDQYLSRLRKLVNTVSVEDWLAVDLPEDYTVLLEFTNGVFDVDLRRAEEPWVAGVGEIDVEYTGDRFHEQSWTQDIGYECSTGWRLGEGDEASEYANIFYLYCRKMNGEDGAWKWRVFYQGSDSMIVYEDLLAYLDWYGMWYDRLDMEALEESFEGIEVDEEDEEDEEE